MGKLTFHDNGWRDYLYWELHNQRILNKVNRLFEEIQRTPFDGIGKPEPLRGDRSGLWSRRIDDEHRLIYLVSGDTVEIISCKGHYPKR